MIQASCPSCGAPLIFAHADALTAVCGSCQGCIARTDRVLEDLGKISAFDRDLSAVQVGASGRAPKGSFRVVGVVRLGRQGVRWNEWALFFDDGSTGWLGESNGQHWLFEDAPVEVAEPPSLAVGSSFRTKAGTWVVAESATAKVLAAEGSLSWRVGPGTRRRYADLRLVGGGLGTLDLEDPDHPMLFTGRATTLAQLKMEGLRPITGWDDPALTNFRGPELAAVEKLACPGCGAGLSINGGLVTSRMVCVYCGAATDLAEGWRHDVSSPASSEPPPNRPSFELLIPLGRRGKLRGVEWQVIGAMQRSVRVDGETYPWVEYFLYNPWHGGAWLVEANRHWSFVELLADEPKSGQANATWDGTRFVAFQSGAATVDRVAGEFTWQVQRGDTSTSRDYVTDGVMLSREDAEGERTWSLGHYLTPAEVSPFAGRGLPGPRGIAPHQPNPWKSVVWGNAALGILAAIGGVLAHAALALAAANETVAEIKFAEASTGEVAVSEFVFPNMMRRDTALKLGCNGSPTAAVVTLIHQATGKTFEQSYTNNASAATEWSLDPGPYIVRLQVESAPEANDCTLTVTRDDSGAFAGLAGVLLGAGALVAVMFLRVGFENTRWQESNFG